MKNKQKKVNETNMYHMCVYQGHFLVNNESLNTIELWLSALKQYRHSIKDSRAFLRVYRNYLPQ